MSERRVGKELPEAPYVSLSEALTWIAFRDAMTCGELRSHVEGCRPSVTDSPQERLRKFFSGADQDGPDNPGLGHFRDRRVGLERLSEAWRHLRDGVDGGTIKVRGRFTAKYSVADGRLADVVILTGDILATFSQFDLTSGGIRRQPEGTPEVLWQDDPHSFGREFEAFGGDVRATGGYLMVEVERTGLLGNGSARTSRAPSVKVGRPPSDEQVVAKAKEMKALGMDGRSIAQNMRHEAGFEHVATTHVRELITGLWKPGGRPRRKG